MVCLMVYGTKLEDPSVRISDSLVNTEYDTQAHCGCHIYPSEFTLSFVYISEIRISI
jgi:hypothetical protein